jgi:hypothetical protein
MQLLCESKDDGAEDESPYRAVRNNFERVSRLEQRPIQRKEPPQDVRAKTKEKT